MGIFAGAQIDYIDSDFYAYISPGYRLNFNDNGYVALSLDYTIFNQQIYGYDLDYQYFLANAKIFGQLFVMNNGHFFGDINANVKVSEEVV